MDALQFKLAFDRVLAFWHVPDETKEPVEHKSYLTWAEVIYDKVRWIDEAKFILVIDALLDVRPRFRKDLDHRKIVAIYNELADKNGWKKGESKSCVDCKGAHFVYIWVTDKAGHEFRATKGCGNCNKKYANLHPDFTEIDRPYINPEPGRVQVRTIPPAMAQCLIGIADESRLNLPEDMLNDLMQAAAQPDAKDMPRAINAARRKNELVLALVAAPSVSDAGTAGEPPAKTEPSTVPTERPSPAAYTEEVEEDFSDVPF